ncbi:MAG: hypothetical protein KBC15_04295 [Candidatus Levybacteria bacterium]|nr:hypothetical protein [Candidatus Levybacteria bacterium]
MSDFLESVSGNHVLDVPSCINRAFQLLVESIEPFFKAIFLTKESSSFEVFFEFLDVSAASIMDVLALRTAHKYLLTDKVSARIRSSGDYIKNRAFLIFVRCINASYSLGMALEGDFGKKKPAGLIAKMRQDKRARV